MKVRPGDVVVLDGWAAGEIGVVACAHYLDGDANGRVIYMLDLGHDAPAGTGKLHPFMLEDIYAILDHEFTKEEQEYIAEHERIHALMDHARVLDNMNGMGKSFVDEPLRKGDVVVISDRPEHAGEIGLVIEPGPQTSTVQTGSHDSYQFGFDNKYLEVIDHIDEPLRKGDVVVINCEPMCGEIGEVRYDDDNFVTVAGKGEGSGPAEVWFQRSALEVIDHIDREVSEFKVGDRVEYTGDLPLGMPSLGNKGTVVGHDCREFILVRFDGDDDISSCSSNNLQKLPDEKKPEVVGSYKEAGYSYWVEKIDCHLHLMRLCEHCGHQDSRVVSRTFRN